MQTKVLYEMAVCGHTVIIEIRTSYSDPVMPTQAMVKQVILILKPATENKSGLVRGCLQLSCGGLSLNKSVGRSFSSKTAGLCLSSSSIQRPLTMGLPTLKPGTAMGCGRPYAIASVSSPYMQRGTLLHRRSSSSLSLSHTHTPHTHTMSSVIVFFTANEILFSFHLGCPVS